MFLRAKTSSILRKIVECPIVNNLFVILGEKMRVQDFLWITVLLPMILPATPEDSLRQRMVRDIEFIHNVFEVKYAPAEWKKRYADWDLNREIELVVDKISSSEELSTKIYQTSIKKFFQSAKDYHVGVQFWSTEWASLPFRVFGVQGRYYITYIDRSRLPSRSFPFQIGDELVQFDGRATAEVIDELKESEMGNASPDTDQALTESFLTIRQGSLGFAVPRGPVTISVRSHASNTVSTYQIIWDYAPEKIKDMPFKRLKSCNTLIEPAKLSHHKFFHKKLLIPTVDLISHSTVEGSCLDPNELGAKKSFIPPLGKILWETDERNPFYAYLFETPHQKKVGYVRIPSYSGGAYETEAFAKIISYLEKNSSALVIDQVNNPGGSVFYLYGLASMLTNQPLYTPKHRMTITQEDVAFALTYEQMFDSVRSDEDARSILGDTMEGYPVNYQTSLFMLNFFRFILDEWNEGRTLTKPYYLYGVDCINHHPETRYTKPILLLVNRLCFSGGDFLPAILQDNRRVTVFGAKTAGAGGYVEGCSYFNSFGVATFHYTASIAERIDNNPIENLGVTPDISYNITEYDIQNNYSEYVESVLHAIDEL